MYFNSGLACAFCCDRPSKISLINLELIGYDVVSGDFGEFGPDDDRKREPRNKDKSREDQAKTSSTLRL